MRKFLTTALILFLMVFIPVEVSANGDENHIDLEAALPQLLEKYDVKNPEDLNCDELTNEDFEFIGDAVMEEMHPGEAHEVMDENMGGEGSESLELMHINMGQNYLGCGDYQGMGSMMMKGKNNMMGGYGMMGGDYEGYTSEKNSIRNLNAYLLPLTLLSMLVFFTTGTYFFIKRLNKNKKK